MHLGQHGAADYCHVLAATRQTREDEYGDLLSELQATGYDDLRIVRRARPKFIND